MGCVVGAASSALGVRAVAAGRLMSSFFRFWKGASKSTVRATEARKIEMNSLVSSCGKRVL